MNKENRDRNHREMNSFPSKGKSVIKTIYLPNEQMNLLAIENENLKKRLAEHELLSHQQIEALRSEIEVIREEGNLLANADRQIIEDLQQRLKKTENNLINVTKGPFFNLFSAI
jgi:coiled-coil domain-containing protein 77